MKGDLRIAARRSLPLVAIACAALCAGACGSDDARDAASAPPPAAAPPPAPAPPPLPALGTATLSVRDGRATLRANQAPLLDTLARLARELGFALETGDVPERPVSASVEAAEPPELLAALLGDLPYRASYAYDWRLRRHALRRLRLGDAPDETPASARPAAEEMRRALREATQRRAAALRDRPPAPKPAPAERRAQREALASADPRARAAAVATLSPAGPDLAVLVDLSRDPAPAVRRAAVARLEDADAYTAVEALLRSLDDPDPGVVVAAIESLETAGDESVIPELQRLLEDPDEEIRQSAADAIEFLGD